MNSITICILVAVFAYLIGSIPFSLLIAKWVKGVDLRTVGSGNIGATNVGRAIGYKWGLLALVCDALKGLVPTLLLPLLAGIERHPLHVHFMVIAGVMAILGHLFPVWLWFKGGKGVATALGVAAILSPGGTLAACVVFILLMVWKRVVSIGSIGAAATFATYQLIQFGTELWTPHQWSLGLFSLLAPVLIIVMHRSNIQRLLRGEEPSLGTPVNVTEEPPAT